MMREEKRSTLVIILIVVIVVLILALLYILVVAPKVNGFVIEKQVDAQRQVIAAMIQSLNQNGFVQISDDQGNTITLVPAQQPTA